RAVAEQDLYTGHASARVGHGQYEVRPAVAAHVRRDDAPRGAVHVNRRGARRSEVARAVAEKDRDGLGGRIHDGQVGRGVAVQIGAGQRARPRPGGQWRRGPRTNAAATVAEEEGDLTAGLFVSVCVVLVEAVGDGKIGHVVAVEVGDSHPG